MKPILFNTEMVEAILAGQKAQTRRLIKPQPPFNLSKKQPEYDELLQHAPYREGEEIYVRETWAVCRPWRKNNLIDDYLDYYIYRAGWNEPGTQPRWRPSIHMPEKAARIFLQVTDVRPEKLRKITIAGAKLEGAESKEQFEQMWNRTIKPKERSLYGWDANPWVWVISFKTLNVPTFIRFVNDGWT